MRNVFFLYTYVSVTLCHFSKATSQIMGTYVQMLIVSGDQATPFQDPTPIESILSSYTTTPDVGMTMCQITKQKILDDTVEGQSSLEIQYSCNFTVTSSEISVSSLPKAFVAFINDNLSIVHSDLAGFGVLVVFPVKQITTQSTTESTTSPPTTTPITAKEVSTQRLGFQQMYKVQQNTTELDEVGEILLSMHLQHYCMEAIHSSATDQAIQVNCQVSRQSEAPDSHIIIEYVCTFRGLGLSNNDTSTTVKNYINQNIDQYTSDMESLNLPIALSLSMQSIRPSSPTTAPSVMPSETGSFRQAFRVPVNQTLFADMDLFVFQTLFEAYTRNYADGTIHTTCQIDSQLLLQDPQPKQYIQLDYTCFYLSSEVDLTIIPGLYVLEMNSDLEQITSDVQKLQVPVLEAKRVQILGSSSPNHRALQKRQQVTTSTSPAKSGARKCNIFTFASLMAFSGLIILFR